MLSRAIRRAPQLFAPNSQSPLKAGLTAIALLGLLSTAHAQYSVLEWTNFEDGKLPATSVLIGLNPAKVLQVVELDKVAGMPPEFRAPAAARETGRYGLKLSYAPDANSTGTYMQGLLAATMLDRDTLGQNGRALLQADVFLPTGNLCLPVAVVGMEKPDSPDGKLPANLPMLKGEFYRFGLMRSQKTAFFSYISRSLGGKPSQVFKDPKIVKSVSCPGWHRIAIVFEGASTLRCYIDGQEANFSPRQQPELRKLLVGLVLVDNTKHPYDVYVDNISIQTSQEAPGLPESPYAAKKAESSAPSLSAALSSTGASSAPSLSAISGMTSKAPSSSPSAPASPAGQQWLEPEQAWALAQQQGRPMLLYFYAPGIPGTIKVDEYMASNPQAAEFLKRHICARVDTNQLQGGTLAQKYDIFKVPTLLVIAPDARSHVRAVYSRTDTWETLESQLKLPTK